MKNKTNKGLKECNIRRTVAWKSVALKIYQPFIIGIHKHKHTYIQININIYFVVKIANLCLISDEAL